MDIFSLDDQYVADTDVYGVEKAIWVERYNSPGEFEFTGDPLSLREDLPIGTLVSHSKTNQVMIVEAHSIDEYEDKTATVTIVGRSLDAVLMENRVVTFQDTDTSWSTTIAGTESIEYASSDSQFILTEGSTWSQVVSLINRHLVNSDVAIENIPNFMCFVSPDLNALGDSPANRLIKTLSLVSDAVYPILQGVDVGIMIERPSPERIHVGPPSSLFNPDTGLGLVIHHGLDKTDAVIFDMSAGDLKSARYVWSDKHLKTAHYGGLDGTIIRNLNAATEVSGIGLREASVNISDYIDNPDSSISDSAKASYIDTVGRLKRDSLKGSSIVEAVVSKTANPAYNIDYRIGDLVHVKANYGILADMRVVEHALTSDSTGEESIPTLAPPYFTGAYSA